MNKMEDPKYKERIVGKIKTIESAIEDLTENEISAAVCTAITGVLFDKGLCPLELKQFYAEMAVNAIDKTSVSMALYRRFKDDAN